MTPRPPRKTAERAHLAELRKRLKMMRDYYTRFAEQVSEDAPNNARPYYRGIAQGLTWAYETYDAAAPPRKRRRKLK